jgi:hypothetical protein
VRDEEAAIGVVDRRPLASSGELGRVNRAVPRAACRLLVADRAQLVRYLDDVDLFCLLSSRASLTSDSLVVPVMFARKLFTRSTLAGVLATRVLSSRNSLNRSLTFLASPAGPAGRGGLVRA